MTFGSKTLNTHRPPVDRFVPPRDSFPEMQRRMLWGAHSNQHNGNIWCEKYLKQKKYMKYIDDAFELDHLSIQEGPDESQDCVQSWPCVPRRKTHLSSADSILDLPFYSDADFPDLLDWSNDNVLVAALGRNYHKWSWHSQSLIGQGLTLDKIFCCKFDPRGELLALGTRTKAVEVHDNVLNIWLVSAACHCFKTDREICSITAVDWSPTGNSFVTGCSRGMLVSLTRKAKLVQYRRVVQHEVLAVKVSPDARFVAAAPVSGGYVHILTWPHLDLYSNVVCEWNVRTLAWHPWRSALLGIGSMNSWDMSNIVIWNAPSGKTKKARIGRTPHSLDTMLFSKRTGELVLSLWNPGHASNAGRNSFQLVVMSDLDTVVDQWGEGRMGLDRVRTMVFSPDGTKLATATTGEDLIIWNFLPEDKMIKNENCRRFSAIPVYLDQASYGVSLR